MALPKISYPTISLTVPPEKTSYTFRPMLVKEEKLLLMAKVSEDQTDMLTAIKQVVNNCSMDPTFDVDKIPLFALEYLFVRLRGFSIGDNIKVSYRDMEDQQVYDFEVDLKNVDIKYPEKQDTKIAITDKSGLVMQYPPAYIYDDKIFLKSDGDETFYRLVVRCIGQIYDTDNVYEGKDFSEDDLLEFLELMDLQSFDKVREFMSNLPSLYYKLEYKNAMGADKTIELTSLSDFFTLR
ncbi:Baseplate hub assembly protein, bacteriophage T4-like [uncultured Caudovirales phage]|uniref:Baseplate hub assembly protein, bacteriophage T4-like n=1 Tax=uncultured Caudovirales phage TaxID=2100421 RepID=A0A6J5LE78_9CAUD|nr:Baseplate hub assembly protein, bacteriophage T4-like [uncultured Caudovirales phage]